MIFTNLYMSRRIIIFDCVICINTPQNIHTNTLNIMFFSHHFQSWWFQIKIMQRSLLRPTAIMSDGTLTNTKRTRKSKPFEIESRTNGNTLWHVLVNVFLGGCVLSNFSEGTNYKEIVLDDNSTNHLFISLTDFISFLWWVDVFLFTLETCTNK